MAERIEVTVAPTAFTVPAGDTAEAIATLRNLGQTVDQLTLNIDGLDPGWYTLPVSSVALFPNDQDNLRIILHPPKIAETKAGSYPFRIKVTSQENPEEIATVELGIEVRALPGLELDISPQRVAGRKGVYQIVANNMGDSEATVHLKASDAQGRLRYYLRPESLTVPGGGRSEATLEVRLRWLTWFGGEKEFEFKVLAVPPEIGRPPEEAITINGQFVRIPWYRTLPQIRLPWLARPPVIATFSSTTEDKREFKLSWSVKRAAEVKLDDEDVDARGERLVRPSEVIRYVLTASNKNGSSTQTIEVKPLPVPRAKASERIRVSLSPTELQASAGGMPAQATLQLQNLGEIVDKFTVEIEGLEETWYSRSASSIALMPQATDQVQISFQPPKRKGVKAKVYPFAITVRSQSTPEEATSVVGQLEVQPSVEFKLGVRPHRVSCRKKGTYRINLANVGTADANFTLEATDLDEGLRFRFQPDNPVVAAWNTIEVPMLARPKRGSMVGEKKRYDITVTVIAGEGNTQSINCELNHKPFIGSWRTIFRVIKTLLILAVVVVAVYLILNLGGGWGALRSSPQTWVNQLIHTIEGWFFR